jgi:hypothetical protein
MGVRPSVNDAKLRAYLRYGTWLPVGGNCQVLDPQLNDVPSLQVHGEDSYQAQTPRCPRADDVTRKKSHELADISHESRNVEDHVGSRTLLAHGAVDHQPDAQISYIDDLIGSCKEWAERCKLVSKH